MCLINVAESYRRLDFGLCHHNWKYTNYIIVAMRNALSCLSDLHALISEDRIDLHAERNYKIGKKKCIRPGSRTASITYL